MIDTIDNVSPEDYAAYWGCDPCYDRSPRLPGDGYLFYNFAVEKDDPEFLGKFIPAIQRTIALVESEKSIGDVNLWTEDILNLELLLQHVRELIQDMRYQSVNG